MDHALNVMSLVRLEFEKFIFQLNWRQVTRQSYSAITITRAICQRLLVPPLLQFGHFFPFELGSGADGVLLCHDQHLTYGKVSIFVVLTSDEALNLWPSGHISFYIFFGCILYDPTCILHLATQISVLSLLTSKALNEKRNIF